MSRTPRALPFAARYRRERRELGDALPDLMLSAFLDHQVPRHQRTIDRLRAWLAPLSAEELSAELETVLEGDDGHRRHGAFATGADVACWMARNTIVPCMLDGPVLAQDLAERLAVNDDLEEVAVGWLARAKRGQLERFQLQLEALRVLDPTCGTGPFLIAALRVLEKLHRACLARLGRRRSSKEVRRRIIERNLFGVDLSVEAVQVCRLRLRLECGDGPLPEDNLHAGNILEPPSEDWGKSFDVVLGNPPYQELREVDYVPQGFRCQQTGAVHALCVERSLDFLKPRGRASMVVPLSLVSTQRMQCVQELLETGRDVWYANFSWRPGRLFAGVNRAVTIFLAAPSDRPRTWTTTYQKWHTADRPTLLSRVRYVEVPRPRPAFWVPKLGDEREVPLLAKLLRVPTVVEDFLGPSKHRVYYRTDGGLYWKVFTDFAPSFSCDGKPGHSTRQTWVMVREASFVMPLIAALSSDLFWWWYTVTSNCRHLNPVDLHRFPLPATVLADTALARLGREYQRDIVRHSAPRVRRQRQTGRTETQTFRIHKSRPILIEIGRQLAPHYGLSAEEQRFVENYDQEFRMGGR